MSEDPAETLAERPDLRPGFEAALEAENSSSGEPWTFDDIDTDSGTFGELVSRGIVESEGDGYRMPDVSAVRAALAAEREDDGAGSEESGNGSVTDSVSVPTPDVGVPSSALSLPSVDRNLTGLSDRVGYDTRIVAAVAAVTLSVIVIRLVSWSSVFPGGDVVLTGNDPWFYRYWVDQSLMSGWGDAGPIASGVTAGSHCSWRRWRWSRGCSAAYRQSGASWRGIRSSLLH